MGARRCYCIWKPPCVPIEILNSRTETLLKEDQPSFNIPANSTLAAVVDPSPLRSGLKCYHQSVRAVGLWGMGRYWCCWSGNSTVGTGFGLRNPPCWPLTRERGWKHVILYNCAELGLTWPFWECIGGNNTFTKNPGVMRQDSIRGTSGPDIWTTLIKILKKRMFPVPVKLAVAGINDIFNVRRWSDIQWSQKACGDEERHALELFLSAFCCCKSSSRWMEECVQPIFCRHTFPRSGNRVFDWVWTVGGRMNVSCTSLLFPCDTFQPSPIPCSLHRELRTSPLDRWQYWRKRWNEEVSKYLYSPPAGSVCTLIEPSLLDRIYTNVQHKQGTLCLWQICARRTAHCTIFVCTAKNTLNCPSSSF